MRLSDKISAKFDVIQNYLDLASLEIKKLPVEYVSQADAVSIYNDLLEIMESVENLHYETCMPLEAEEDEKLAKIEKMEQELFELRASLR